MPAQTQITFHNGVNVIGGTIVEVAYADTSVLIDFSSEMDSMDLPPEGLPALIASGAFPRLYDYLDPCQLALPEDQLARSSIHQRAVFLTHAHLDHSLWLNWLDPAVPLYSSPATSQLLPALNVWGDFLAPPAHPLAGGALTRTITALDPEKPLTLGPIQVELIPVDHDLPGACGLRLVTPDAVIAYTGDFRFHGFRSAETWHFIDRCKGCDVLIIEGVSVSNFEPGDPAEDDGFLSEADLALCVRDLLLANPQRNVSFNYHAANTERIAYWKDQVQDLRLLVLDAYSAYLAKTMTGLSLPWYRLDRSQKALPGLDPACELPLETLLEDRQRFFWQLDTAVLDKIGRQLSGGLYIHADAPPLGKWSLEWEPFSQLFQSAGLETCTLSSSGHARTLELQALVDAIGPHLVCPVHTSAPDRVVNKAGGRLLPEKGQSLRKNPRGVWTLT